MEDSQSDQNTHKKDSIEGIDFSIWEKLYGRELRDVEKLEIKTKLSDFARTLIKADLQRREKDLEIYRKSVRSLLISDGANT